MMNKNMMGQIPGMQDTAGIAIQQALAAQQQVPSPFSPQALQTAQGVYGTDLQKSQSLMQGGTSAALI